MQTVYVDILVLTNFIVDYFLLMLCARFIKAPIKRWRLLFSSGAASFSSLLIFAPELPAVLEIIIKLLISLLVVFLAFGYKNYIRYIKSAVFFYASNVLFAGGALLLWSFFKTGNIVVRNGAVFYNISPITLILTTAVVYIISLIVSKIISRRKNIGKEYTVTLKLQGKEVDLVGIVDNGNMLTDVLSGSPVIVCDYRKIKPILTDEMIKIFKKQNFELGFYEDIITSSFSERFRVIPFDSLGESGLMAALIIDSATLKSDKDETEIQNIIMAVTHKKIAGGEFDVLLNPELIAV